MNTKEHWIDFIKFDIQNDYKTRQESIFLAIALIGSSFFLYSLIFSIYKFDLIANIACILIFLYAIISIVGATVFVKEMYAIPFKKSIGGIKRGYLFTFFIFFIIIIIVYVINPNYFKLTIFIIPLFLTLIYGVYFVLIYINLLFRTPFKEELLIEIIRGNVSEELIYPYIQQVNKAYLKDIILGVFKSITQSQKSNINK